LLLKSAGFKISGFW